VDQIVKDVPLEGGGTGAVAAGKTVGVVTNGWPTHFDDPSLKIFCNKLYHQYRNQHTEASNRLSVTKAQGCSSGAARVFSLQAGQHHRPMFQHQQSETRVKMLQKGTQK
jgi:hypothetical protein